ncbi:helix-turn-helix domain-containing protein [Streptomyces sp. NPDC089424]|uniref:helix-turn-helix domain-containing protein n=1 Tax=Streptomyces sp. NPDC089424 TaxID=3365917 RepID=UPI003807ED17
MSTDVQPTRAKWQPVRGDARARMRAQAATDYATGSSIRAVAAHLSEHWGPVSFGLARDLLLEADVPMRSKSSTRRRPRP